MPNLAIGMSVLSTPMTWTFILKITAICPQWQILEVTATTAYAICETF